MDGFDVSDSTLLNHVRKTMDYITSLNVIQFPTQAQQLDIKRKFEEAGFLNTIGAVDGCHVSIKAQQMIRCHIIIKKALYQSSCKQSVQER